MCDSRSTAVEFQAAFCDGRGFLAACQQRPRFKFERQAGNRHECDGRGDECAMNGAEHGGLGLTCPYCTTAEAPARAEALRCDTLQQRYSVLLRLSSTTMASCGAAAACASGATSPTTAPRSRISSWADPIWPLRIATSIARRRIPCKRETILSRSFCQSSSFHLLTSSQSRQAVTSPIPSRSAWSSTSCRTVKPVNCRL